MNMPEWNSFAKSASIRECVEELHKEAMRLFLQDKTHASILFLFKDEGLVSVNLIPPNTTPEQVRATIIDAIGANDLYGVIHIGEAWAYFSKPHDHTMVQLSHGEMKVSDLKPEDKSEVLYLRMESKDGDCLIHIDRIIRAGEAVSLGESKTLDGEKQNWFS